MILIAILLTIVFAALWVRTLIGIRQTKKITEFPLRGMIKFYAKEAVPAEARPLFRTWFLLSWGFTLSVWLLVALLTLRTDYNFLIGIFPFLWYYVVFRYFFWEKSDLTDEPSQ